MTGNYPPDPCTLCGHRTLCTRETCPLDQADEQDLYSLLDEADAQAQQEQDFEP